MCAWFSYPGIPSLARKTAGPSRSRSNTSQRDKRYDTDGPDAPSSETNSAEPSSETNSAGTRIKQDASALPTMFKHILRAATLVNLVFKEGSSWLKRLALVALVTFIRYVYQRARSWGAWFNDQVYLNMCDVIKRRRECEWGGWGGGGGALILKRKYKKTI